MRFVLANDINNPLGDLADRFNYRDELNDTQGGELNFEIDTSVGIWVLLVELKQPFQT